MCFGLAVLILKLDRQDMGMLHNEIRDWVISLGEIMNFHVVLPVQYFKGRNKKCVKRFKWKCSCLFVDLRVEFFRLYEWCSMVFWWLPFALLMLKIILQWNYLVLWHNIMHVFFLGHFIGSCWSPQIYFLALGLHKSTILCFISETVSCVFNDLICKLFRDVSLTGPVTTGLFV